MNENDMQHGADWDGANLAGWYLTEKFDGCRAYWDGRTLWSRGGLAISMPPDMRAALPDHALDCELYDGTDGRSRCAVAARWGRFTDSMRLAVFDAPDADGDQLQRLATVVGSERVTVAPLWIATSTADAVARMRQIQARGGEGLVCAEPGRPYVRARVRHLMKLKAAF